MHLDEGAPHMHLMFVPVVHTKVKEGKEMDMIMTGLFEGNETMFRITKGSDHNCTTWYKNGNTWSWHHGIGGYTMVADSVWDTWRAIESMIASEGIDINKRK